MMKLARRVRPELTGISVNLPGVSLNLSFSDNDARVAREIVIRLRDRRVLSSWQCCPTCTAQAMLSLQEIRRLLVDKQVELADDSNLFPLVEMMLVGIRDFLTLAEQMELYHDHRPVSEAMEVLRRHLHRCLLQVARAGGAEPHVFHNVPFDPSWDSTDYVSDERDALPPARPA
jgi:hypothetical protein